MKKNEISFKNQYRISVSGNLGPNLTLNIIDNANINSYKAKRKYRINFENMYSDINLEYYGGNLKKYKLFWITLEQIYKSFFFQPKLFFNYFFYRYHFLIETSSEDFSNVRIQFDNSTDVWFSRTAQLTGYFGKEVGFLNDINKFRTKDLNRIYVLDIELKNRASSTSLEARVKQAISKNEFTNDPLIEQIPQGTSRSISIKNALITSQHFVFTKNSIFPACNKGVFTKIGWPTDLLLSQDKVLSSVKFSREIKMETGVTCKFSNSWYHFLIDTLPLILKYRNEIQNAPFLVFGDIPLQIIEILISVTGINPVVLPNDTTIKVSSLVFLQDYRFDDLYDFNERKEDIESLRNYFRGQQAIKYFIAPTKKIFLARETGLFRQLKNWHEVQQLLTNYGFEIVYPNRMRFEDQMKLYSQTKILIAETGAALTNTLLLPDQSTVIELKFGKIVDHIWPNFFAQSNLNYMQCQMRVNSMTGQGSLDLRKLSSILSSLE